MPGMYETKAWGKVAKGSKFSEMKIQRNLPGAEDVTFELKFCGICHTDVHIADNHFGKTSYPCVPGHELAGVVTAVGAKVKAYKVGDKVGVGCVADSCLNCKNCDDGFEHTCSAGMTMTYDSETKHGHLKTNTGYTFGGYSGSETVHQRFLVKIPDSYPLEAAGPVFCAGITMYSPLAHWKATSGGLNVGVVGIGGLGQMGVRLAKAMGNKVTAISTSPNKKPVALEIGADDFIVSTDADSMAAGKDSLDLILNTVAAPHEISTYLPLLRRDGTLVQIGLDTTPHTIIQLPIMNKRIKISGSMIGGMKETQECMDFCAKNKIVPATQLITAAELDGVYEVLEKKNDQVIRYVLDIAANK